MGNYGEYFKALRGAKGLTLRDVEKETDISNAYLSQLESGKIKQPSPTHLYKLAELYGVEYELLMEKVGYPVPKSATPIPKANKGNVYGRFGKISTDEELELLQYLKFIRKRNQK
jgi:transcriptional regulator with XRE-family HTH domain